MGMEYIPGQVKGDHVLLTGPITGTVTLDDGTVVDVTQPVIAVTDDNAEEIAAKIGERYSAEGHPDDVELDSDPDSDTYGQMVQREFVFDAETSHSNFEAAAEAASDTK